MKARRVFDIILGLSVVALAGYFIFSRFINPPKPAEKKVKLVKANDLLKYKTEVAPSIVNTSLTSAACTAFLKDSAEKTMMEYANEFIDHHVDSILKTCSGAFPSALQAKIDDVVLKCKDSTREKISNECFAALLSAKTSSVATVIKPDVDPKELNSTLLLHLIAEKFSNGDFFEHPDKSLDIVDALLDKEPGYLGGYKVKMMLLSMSSLNKDEHYKQEFVDTVEQAKRLNPDDPEILEMEIAQKGDVFNIPADPNEKKDQTEFLRYLNTESAKHPDEWIYDYYKAQAIYNNGYGNSDKAIAFVEKALKKAPNDMRLKQTLENLKSDDEQRIKHPFILSIGFSLNDL